jgi:hypothetical protein
MNEIIYSPQFINWFGDWRNGNNCSKVVDNNGLPLIVYHGTESEFDEFKSKFMGKNGTAIGQGFYFSSNKDDAGMFGPNVKAFYLNIRKPLSLDKLTMKPNEIAKLLDSIDKQQCQDDPEFGYGILSDYGDVYYEGRNKVLRNAVELLLDEENDVELVGGLINTSGDYNLVTNVLYNTLGYDGVFCLERSVYVAHHPNQIKSINNTKFDNTLNNFNESHKIIHITENQYNFLTKGLK